MRHEETTLNIGVKNELCLKGSTCCYVHVYPNLHYDIHYPENANVYQDKPFMNSRPNLSSILVNITIMHLLNEAILVCASIRGSFLVINKVSNQVDIYLLKLHKKIGKIR